MQVLYVDDEAGLLEVGKVFLESQGEFSVDTVLSASAALEMLNNRTVDAIVSDYQMPDMDGIAFLKAVRAQFSDLPFILFTGRGREEVVIQAINNGADFYLQKGGDPTYQYAELAHKIRQAVKRRKAEEALRASEEKYRGIFDESIATVFVFDDKKNFINANQAGLDLLGYSREELLRMSIPDVDADPVVVLPAHQELLSGGRIINFEHRLKRKDGTVIDVLNNSRPLTDASGNVIGLLSTLIDITGRKKAEDDLRAAYERITAEEEELRNQLDEIVATQLEKAQTEQNFRTLVDNAPDAIFIATADRRYRYVNTAFVRLMGASSAEDLLGTTTFDRIHPSLHDNISQRIHDLTVNLKTAELQDEIYLRLDGKPIDVEAVAVPCRYLGEHAVLVMLRDITVRKQTETEIRAAYEQIAAAEEELRGQYEELARSERAIRESEESYRGLFNTVRQAIYIQDSDWKFIDVNEGAEAMYGYRKEDFIGRTPEFLSAEGRNDLTVAGELMKKAFAGEPQQFVFWAKRKNGQVFPKDVRLYSGIYFGRHVLIAIGTDITEIKRAEEEQRERYNRLAQDGKHAGNKNQGSL